MDRKSKYTKILTTILIIFIMLIILSSFILSESKYIITFEIIICLVLIIILVLADSFDNLSIPKILSLSKSVNEVKKENMELKDANIKLLEQVVSIKNSNNQNIYLPNSFSTIGSSDINDINKTKENESINEQREIDNTDDLLNKRILASERHKYRNVFEIYILQKALNSEPSNSNIQYDVKLINNKPIEDNIMKNEARFDAWKSDGKNNIFYEVKMSPFWLDYPYQLHYMLRTIELYQESSKCPSKLVLILPNVDKDLEKILFNRTDNRFSLLKERINSRFEPAITNGLLEVLEIDVSKKELDDYLNQKENN